MNKKVFFKNRPFDINDAADWQNWTEESLKTALKTIYTSGIANGLNVTIKGGLSLYVNTGYGFDNNFDYINVTSQQTVTLSAAESNPRYDLIVIKYKQITVDNADTDGSKYGMGSSYIYSQNKLDGFEIQLIKGTAAASPTIPAVPTNSLALAAIYVPNGAASIIAGNITDRRVFLGINESIIKPEIVIGKTQPTNTNVFWIDTN